MVRLAIVAWMLMGGLGSCAVVPGQEVPAGEARLDLVVHTGEILNPRLAPSIGAVHRMDWVEEADSPKTAWATVPVVDFSETAFELRFSVSRDTTVQIDFMGPWEPDGAGGLKPRIVQWVSARSTHGELQGFRAGEAWHDRRIVCQLNAKAGTEIALQCVATVPNRFRDTKTWRPAADSPAFELAKHFRRGVNLANFLEVPPGEDWGDNTIRQEDFRKIAAEGFDHVRIAVGWHHYVGPGPEFTVSNLMQQRVGAMLDGAAEAGLGAIINVHHFNEFNTDPEGQRKKLFKIWEQVARLVRDRPLNVALEILNEPNDQATTSFMNGFYAELIPAIRAIDPGRAILVGPGNFNQVNELGNLTLPEDDRLIVTIHNYTPHFFTHQSAWWGADTRHIRGVTFPGPPENPVAVPALLPQYLKDQLERYNVAPGDENPCSPAAIAAELKLASDWGRHWNRPVYLGEFGVFVEVDGPSRARYCEAMRRKCEELGIGWSLWDWKATFNYWDRGAQQPLPGMHDALFGK